MYILCLASFLLSFVFFFYFATTLSVVFLFLFFATTLSVVFLFLFFCDDAFCCLSVRQLGQLRVLLDRGRVELVSERVCR
jgi:hypothetical protein